LQEQATAITVQARSACLSNNQYRQLSEDALPSGLPSDIP
jgi:hypothetical protein